MTREKIVALAEANGCHMPYRSGSGDCRVPQFFSVDGLVKFYHAAQAEAFEAAAVKCEQMEVRFDTRVWMYSTKEELTCITAKTIGNAIREMAKENGE